MSVDDVLRLGYRERSAFTIVDLLHTVVVKLEAQPTVCTMVEDLWNPSTGGEYWVDLEVTKDGEFESLTLRAVVHDKED